MLKPEPLDPPKITLEDLLRFKRAERPAPEFWTRFESELRQKQLAALVKKESWWQRTSRFFTRFSRLHVPVGATAMLALLIVTLRTYQEGIFPREATAGKAIAGAPPPALADVGALSADKRVGLVMVADRPALTAAFAEPGVPTPAVAPSRKTSGPVSAAMAPQEIAGMIPWLGASAAEPSSARALAAGFAAADSAGLLGQAHAFEARMLSARAESLVGTASVSHRAARLVMDGEGFDASYLSALTVAPEPVRARLARYLVEDGFEQTNRRLGAQGDRVSFKF